MDAGTFEKAMQRGYSTKGDDADHHGLGLALVAQVVKRHEGTLTADVTYGSVVTVTVSGGIMITVLIVEDEPLIAEAHQTYLGRLEGFSVAAVAHTARDAMRAASEAAATETPIDLVLLDIGLPDANGIALASALSGLRPAPDIITITSERDLEMVRAAVGHGALAYLLKPFTFAAFRDRLERYRRYREALPAGTEAASQAEVDRALAELRVSDRTAGAQGRGAGHQRRNRPGGKGFRRRHHRRRSGQAGRRVAGDRVAIPGTAGRRGHGHPSHGLRQGGTAQDPLPVALSLRLPASYAGAGCSARRVEGDRVGRQELRVQQRHGRRDGEHADPARVVGDVEPAAVGVHRDAGRPRVDRDGVDDLEGQRAQHRDAVVVDDVRAGPSALIVIWVGAPMPSSTVSVIRLVDQVDDVDGAAADPIRRQHIGRAVGEGDVADGRTDCTSRSTREVSVSTTTSRLPRASVVAT